MIEVIFIVLLSLVCVILSIGLVAFVRVGLQAVRLNKAYEEFYNSTLDDADATLKMLDVLMNRRQLLSDDPDVQNMYRLFGIFHDIVAGYVNAGKRPEEKRQQ